MSNTENTKKNQKDRKLADEPVLDSIPNDEYWPAFCAEVNRVAKHYAELRYARSEH